MHTPRYFAIALAGLAFSACDNPSATCPSDLAPEPLVVADGSAPARPAAPSRTLTVTGTGVVFGAPDTVTATLGVQTRGSDAGAAITDNHAVVARITSTLVALGIDDSDILPGGYSTGPQGEYDPETGQLREPVTHQVDSTISITFGDPQQLGEVLEKALAAGATTIHGVTYGMSDPSTAADRARDLALTDARARAEQMARAAGVALGQPVTISESNAGSGPFSAEQAMMTGSPFGSRPFQIAHHITVAYAIR